MRAMSTRCFIDRSVSAIASGWRQPVGWQLGTLKKAPKRNLRPVDFMTHHRKNCEESMQLVCQENRRAAIPGACVPRPVGGLFRQYQYPESLSVNLVPNQGGLADVRVQHAVVLAHAVVEGTHQGPVVRLYRRLAGLDAGRVRLHDLPAHHGADRRRNSASR